MKHIIPIAALFISLLMAQPLHAQSNAKINRLLKSNSFKEAATAYQKRIISDPSSSNYLGLATCYYKMKSYNEANEIYQKLWKEDKLKAVHMKRAADTKLILGDVKNAKILLKFYLTENTDDEALLLLQNMEQMASIQSLYPNAQLNPFEFNTSADENAPYFDGKHLYYSSDQKRSSLNPLRKKNGATGRSFFKIYKSSLSDSAFEEPVVLGKEVNTMNLNTASLTMHENTVIFARNSIEADKSGEQSIHLYAFDLDDPFVKKETTTLNFCRVGTNYLHPTFSKDGKTLFFASDKAGGAGGLDIFYSTIKKGKWSYPKPLDTTINTIRNEGYPYIDDQNNLFFASNGHPGFGGYDIYKASFNGKDWDKPVNVGYPVNSSSDDFGLIKHLNQIIFTTNRDGSDDLYLFDAYPNEAPMQDIDQMRGTLYEQPLLDEEKKPKRESGIAFKYFNPNK